MARLALALASLSLLSVAALAGVVTLSAPQPHVTAEQLQGVTARLDRMATDLEAVRRAQSDQAAALDTLTKEQERASGRIATAMDLAASKSQADADLQRGIGDLRQASATMQREITELQQAVAALRQNAEATQTGSAAARQPAQSRVQNRAKVPSAQSAWETATIPVGCEGHQAPNRQPERLKGNRLHAACAA